MASHRTARRSTVDRGAELVGAHLQRQGPRHFLLPFQVVAGRHFLLFFFQTGIWLVPFILGQFVEVQYLRESGDGSFETAQTAGNRNSFRNVFNNVARIRITELNKIVISGLNNGLNSGSWGRRGWDELREQRGGTCVTTCQPGSQ